MSKFLKAKTMFRMHHHITKDLVEAGNTVEHGRREVERLVGNMTVQSYVSLLGIILQVCRSTSKQSVQGRSTSCW